MSTADSNAFGREGDEVEKAMANALDEVQDIIAFPTKDSSKKASSLKYSISASIDVSLDTQWEIMSDFVLRQVQFRSNVKKMKGQTVQVGVHLSAIMVIPDSGLLRVSGNIPRLQKDRDIEFVLNVQAVSALEPIPADTFLSICAMTDKTHGQATSTAGISLLDTTSDLEDDSIAVAATLSVVRSHKTNSYHIKSFEIALGVQFEWDIVPERVQLRQANAALKFSRSKVDDPFEGHLALDGLARVEKAFDTQIQGMLLWDQDRTVVALSCDVARYSNRKPSSILSMLAGDNVAQNMSEEIYGPPDLSYSSDGTHAFSVFVVFEKLSGASWKLNEACTALLSNLWWKPIDQLEIQQIRLALGAKRSSSKPKNYIENRVLEEYKDSLIPRNRLSESNQIANTDELIYSGYVSGIIKIGDSQAVVSGAYQQDTGVATIRCDLGSLDPTSLITVASDTRFSSLHGASKYGEEELQAEVSGSHLPESCPLKTELISYSGYGSDRHLVIRLKDEQLQQLTFAAIFPYGSSKWKLLDGLELVEMGLWFDIHRSSEPALGPSFKGFAYGSFLVSETVQVFAFVAASKDPNRRNFSVRLSTSLNPSAKLNVKPATILESSTFANLDTPKPGDTWKLPSSLEGDPNPLDAFNSVSADVALQFGQTLKEGEVAASNTSLEFAYVSMALNGEWQLFEGFSLHKLTMGLLIRQKETGDSSYKSLTAEIRGIFDVGSGADARKINVAAIFAKEQESSSFTARLATYTETPDDLQQKKVNVSTNDLLSIPAFGGRQLSDSELASVDGPSSDFPIKKEDFLSATAIECEIFVTKTQQAEQKKDNWDLSRIQFSIETNNKVEIIKGSLTMLNARLAMTIFNLGQAQRTISFTAETTVLIGAVSLNAQLDFVKNEKAKVLVFTVALSPQEINSAVKQLIGQEIKDLLPEGTPEIGKGDPVLKLGITCSSVSNGQDSKETFLLDALDIYFQPSQSWDLEPFVVNNISANVTWKSQAEKKEWFFLISGQTTCNSIPVRAQVSYSTEKPDVLRFSIDTTKGQKLLASDLATVPKLGQPKPDAAPADSPDFAGLAAVSIAGTYKLETKSDAKSWTLWTLDAYIESTKSIQLLQISDDIQISLDRIGLAWQYRADPKTPSAKRLYGFLTIESGANRNEIRLYYSLNADEETYMGEYEAGNTNEELDHKAVIRRFMPKEAFEIPNEIKAPDSVPIFRFTATIVKSKSATISAAGNMNWKIPFEKIDVTLEKVGLDLSVQLGTTEKPGNIYNACFTAGLVLDKFKTASNFRAKLGIGADVGKNKAVLTAQLVKSAGSDDMERLSEVLNTEKWTDIVPVGSQNIHAFNFTAPIFLYIDFISRKMLLTGEVLNGGVGLFLTQKKSAEKQRDYVLSLSTPDLGRVFGWFDSNVGADFDLSPVEISVMAYDGTVADLLSDLQECTTLDRILVPVLPAPAPAIVKPGEAMLAMLPPTKPLKKGAWFFAGIKLSGDNSSQQMSTTLSDCVDPASTPTIWISGRATKDTRRFDVAVKDLVMVGGALRINGIGSYETLNNTNGQRNSSSLVTVQGTIELLQLAPEGQTPTLAVSFIAQKDVTTFSARVQEGARSGPVLNPLGGMYNVALELVSVSGHVMRINNVRETQFSIKGRATFPTDESILAFDVEVVFSSGGIPTLVIGSLPPSTSIIGILNNILKPEPPKDSTPGSWPDDYPDFDLHDAQLWYARQDIDYMGTKYISGYQAEAVIQLFGLDFKVAVKLPSDRSGVTISSTLLQPIDLGFMKFLNPALTIESKGPVFLLSSDLEFFEISGPSIMISYQNENEKPLYRGSLSLKGQKDPLIKVICRDDAWGIESWNLPDHGKFLGENGIGKLQDALIEASDDGGKCGALVDLVFEEVVTTKFSFKILAPMEPDRKLFETVDGVQKLNCTISTFFDVLLLDEPLIKDIKLGNFPLSISGPFTLKRLDEALVNTVKNLFKDIGKTILNSPEDFARLAAYIAVDKLTAKLVKTLLCRGVDTKNVIEKGKEEVRKGQEKAKDSTNDALDKIEKTLEQLNDLGSDASNAVGAAITSLSSAAATLGEAESIFEGLFGAAGALGDLLLVSLAGDELTEFEKIKEGLEKGLTDARSKLEEAKKVIEQSLALAGSPTLALESSEDLDEAEVLAVDWSSVVPETIKQSATVPQLEHLVWEIAITSTDPEEAVNHTVENKNTTKWMIPASNFSKSGVIKAQVRAIVTVQGSDGGQQAQIFTAPFSARAEITFTPRAPPPEPFIFGNVDSHSQEIKLVFSDTALGDQYEVSIGPLGEVENDQHYFRRIISIDDDFVNGKNVLTIPLLKFPDPNVSIPIEADAVEARARRLVEGESSLRDSIWVEATNSINLLKSEGFKDFTATQIAGTTSEILFEWEQDSTSDSEIIDFDLVIFEDQEGKVNENCEQSGPTSEGNRRSVTLKFGDSTTLKEKLSFAIRQSTETAVPDTVSMFHFETVDIKSSGRISISKATFYDLDSQQLHLQVVLSSPLTQNEDVVIAMVPENKPMPAIDISQLRTSPLPTTPIDLIIPIQKTKLPESIQLVVQVDGTEGSRSDIWKFPSLPTSSDMVSDEVFVYWSDQLRVEARQDLDANLPPFIIEFSSQKAPDNGPNAYNIEVKQIYKPPSKLRGTNILPTRTFYRYVPKKLEHPDTLIKSERVLKHAGLSFGWNYGPKDERGFRNRFLYLWYSIKSGLMGVRYDYRDVKTPFTTVTHELSTDHIISGGSTICNLANVQKNQGEQVFFVGRDGSIRQFQRLDSGAEIPFSDKWSSEEVVTDPGVASIIGGGTISYAAHEPALELLWVGPEGQIGLLRHLKDNEEWEKPMPQALPAKTARVTAKSTSPIAMMWYYKFSEGIALFFNPSGGIRMLRVGEGNMQTFDLVPDANAAIGSDLATDALFVQGQEILDPLQFCFWMTDDGSIWCAYGELKTIGPSTGVWKKRRVTARGSAHTSTRFQLEKWSTSSDDMILFFFNPQGQLCVAVASFAKRDSDDNYELQWSVSVFQPEVKTFIDYPVNFRVDTIFPNEHILSWADNEGKIRTTRFQSEIPRMKGNLIMN